jgi:hypothetical protein
MDAVMPSFSPTEAAFEGFRLTREHPRAVLAWVGAYFVFTLSLAVLTIAWVGKDFAVLQALSHQTNPDPTEMMRTFGKLAPFLMVVIPAQVIFFAVLNCAIYRAVLRPFESGMAFLRLGADEMRMIAVISILFLVWLATLFVLTVVVTLAAGTIGVFGGSIGAFFGWLVDMAALCAAVWVLVRLSLAGPMTFEQGRLVVFGSWSFTRHCFWQLTGAYLLAMLMGVVILLLMTVISYALITLSMMATGGALNPVGHDVQADVSSLSAFLTLPTILSQALGSGMVTIYFIIALSPAAIAYQGLADRGQNAGMLV